MIIETHDDVVRLSGTLHKNQWLTIKAAANLLLQHHPQGIIVDCAELENISEDGAKTFLEAMRDIEGAHARIIVANLPENILAVIKTVPGVRSQLPIADSVEAARASLHRMDKASAAAPSLEAAYGGQVILVPLLPGLDLTYGAALAGQLARANKAEVRLVYFLEVARNLPLNSPLPEEEQVAQGVLAQAMQFAKQPGVTAWEHMERVRDAIEGILTTVKTYHVERLVLGSVCEAEGSEGGERFRRLFEVLLNRAPCEVIIGRLKPTEG